MRAIEKKKKRMIWIACLVIFLVISIGSYFFIKNKRAVANEQRVVPYSVTELNKENGESSSQMLTGTIEPKKVTKVLIDGDRGKVTQLHAKVGDNVKKGQKLFTYENPDGDFQMQEVSLSVTQLQQQFQQKETDITNKQNELYEKQTNLNNVIYKMGQVSEDEKESLKAEKQALSDSVTQLNSEVLALQSERATLSIEIEKAQYKQETTNKKFEQKEYLAETDGVVKTVDESLLNQTGEVNGKTIMEIVDSSEYYVSGSVDEFQKEKLTLKGKVTVKDRGDDTKIWSGTLVKIGELGEDSGGDSGGKDENPNLTKYPYRVQLDKADHYPAIGRHVFVQPQSEEADKIKLPKEYVFSEKSSDYVWKVVGEKIIKQKIIVESKATEDRWVIKEGLTKKDQIVPPMKGLKEQMEVGALVKAD